LTPFCIESDDWTLHVGQKNEEIGKLKEQMEADKKKPHHPANKRIARFDIAVSHANTINLY